MKDSPKSKLSFNFTDGIVIKSIPDLLLPCRMTI